MTQLPHGWVKFTGSSFWHMVFGGTPVSTSRRGLLVAIGIYSALYAVITWAPEDLVATILVFAYSTVAIVIAIGLLIAYLRNPMPEANFDTDELRLGKKEIAFAGVTEAAYFTVARRNRTDSHLVFGARTAPRVVVTLASEKAPVLDTASRELVAELLRRSSVAVPEAVPDPYDPSGKFAWMNHPNNLTKDEAIEYVLNTPDSGEPVRTPSRPKSIWIDED